MKSVNLDQRLLTVIDQILSANPQGISEYDLMTEIDQHEASLYPKPDMSEPLLLFQHHFYLRHCLYVLQQQYSEQEHWRLDIQLTRLQKLPYSRDPDGVLQTFDPLREYYLDLSNMNRESELSVRQLLNNFWRAMSAYQHQSEALSVLGLNGHESAAEQKKRYQQLVQQHHPDKGGDEATFRTVREAWEKLNRR